MPNLSPKADELQCESWRKLSANLWTVQPGKSEYAVGIYIKSSSLHICVSSFPLKRTFFHQKGLSLIYLTRVVGLDTVLHAQFGHLKLLAHSDREVKLVRDKIN